MSSAAFNNFIFATSSATSNVTSQFLQPLRIKQFQQKFVFKPFQYPSCLEQKVPNPFDKDKNDMCPTLGTATQLNNVLPAATDRQSTGGGTADAKQFESANSTSKSIQTTSNSILQHRLKSSPSHTKFDDINYDNSQLVKIKSMKSSDLIKRNDRRFNKKQQRSATANNKNGSRLRQVGFSRQGTSLISYSANNNPCSQINNFLSASATHTDYPNGSMCQSVALGSFFVQNYFQNVAVNSKINQMANRNTWTMDQTIKSQVPSSRTTDPHTYSQLYNFCMLLFPQSTKSIPLNIQVLDTLFYTDNKQIVYLFKDAKKGLIKIKNRNKKAFDIFLKRRAAYQAIQLKLQKRRNKLTQSKYMQQDFQGLELNVNAYNTDPRSTANIHSSNKSKNNDKFHLHQQLQHNNDQNLNHLHLSEPCCQNQQNSQISSESYSQSQQSICKNQSILYNQQESQQSHNVLLTQIPKIFFKNSPRNIKHPIFTPQNSVRQSFQGQQTNYIALLRYKDKNFIRLKEADFKSIYSNPLYANERFKNSGRTQYIQSLPFEQFQADAREYSIHFHHQIFHKQPLFLHVKTTLDKQNEYQQSGEDTHPYLNKQKIQNNKLKQYLKSQSIEVFLHYQVFEIWTYINMHHNKKLESGIFKFVGFEENGYALAEVENIILTDLPKQGQFRKAYIFGQQQEENMTNQEKLKQFVQANSEKVTPPNNSTSRIIADEGSTKLQKELYSMFSKQNHKIQHEIKTYLKVNIDKTKNVDDQNLSKSIFKILNPNSQAGLHQILKSQKRTKDFLSQKCPNDIYSRKSISNFSLARNQHRKKYEQYGEYGEQGVIGNIEKHSYKDSQTAKCKLIKLINCQTNASGVDVKNENSSNKKKQQILKAKKALNYKYSMFNRAKFSLKSGNTNKGGNVRCNAFH